jgi:hypothetical protein
VLFLLFRIQPQLEARSQITADPIKPLGGDHGLLVAMTSSWVYTRPECEISAGNGILVGFIAAAAVEYLAVPVAPPLPLEAPFLTPEKLKELVLPNRSAYLIR